MVHISEAKIKVYIAYCYTLYESVKRWAHIQRLRRFVGGSWKLCLTSFRCWGRRLRSIWKSRSNDLCFIVFCFLMVFSFFWEGVWGEFLRCFCSRLLPFWGALLFHGSFGGKLCPFLLLCILLYRSVMLFLVMRFIT